MVRSRLDIKNEIFTVIILLIKTEIYLIENVYFFFNFFYFTTGTMLNPHPGILKKNDKYTNGTLIYKPMVRTKKSSSGEKINTPWYFECGITVRQLIFRLIFDFLYF